MPPNRPTVAIATTGECPHSALWSCCTGKGSTGSLGHRDLGLLYKVALWTQVKHGTEQQASPHPPLKRCNPALPPSRPTATATTTTTTTAPQRGAYPHMLYWQGAIKIPWPQPQRLGNAWYSCPMAKASIMGQANSRHHRNRNAPVPTLALAILGSSRGSLVPRDLGMMLCNAVVWGAHKTTMEQVSRHHRVQ